MPDIHLRYGGSTARRTLNCPGWARLVASLEKKLPKPVESEHAKRGTRLHDIMETAYTENLLVEKVPAYADEEPDDREALRQAQAMVEKVLDQYHIDQIFVEQLVRAEGFEDIVGGSADMLGISEDGKTLLVLDYKFGFKPVDTTEQFQLYGGCTFDTMPGLETVETVVAAVVQPAANDSAALIFEFERGGINQFMDQFLDLVDAAECGEYDAKQQPGDWCGYCPAAPLCPAKRKQAAGFLAYDPSAPAELGAAMKLVDQMKEQIKAIEAAAHAALEQGTPVQGFKLVQKRATRSWSDQDAALALLKKMRRVKRDQYMKEQLHTVAQVEKVFGKGNLPHELAELVSNVSSGTTVVPESDNRDAIVKDTGGGAALAAMLDKTD